MLLSKLVSLIDRKIGHLNFQKSRLLYWKNMVEDKIKNSQTNQIIYCIVLDKSFIVLEKYGKITSNHLLYCIGQIIYCIEKI